MYKQRSPIHKARLICEDGNISAVCYDPPRPIPVDDETWVTSDAMNDEVTCEDCLRVMGIEKEPSLSSLLLDGIHGCLNRYRFVVDLIEFDKEREAVGSEPLGGDSYTDAIKEFEAFANMNAQVMDKIRKRMEPAKSWGWPDLVEEKDA